MRFFRYLLNVFTKGTKGIPVIGNILLSMIPIPTNEDWTFAVEIIAIDEEKQMVSGVKIWDKDGTENGKVFNAWLRNLGQPGDPNPKRIEVGQKMTFHRVGAHNAQGPYTDLALFDKNEVAGKASFLAFIAPLGFIFVRDLGNGTAEEVQYLDTGNVVAVQGSTLPMMPADPLTFFNNNSPPYKTGRIYTACKKVFTANSYYVIFLPAKGDTQKNIDVTLTNDTVRFEVDGSGHLVTSSTLF